MPSCRTMLRPFVPYLWLLLSMVSTARADELTSPQEGVRNWRDFATTLPLVERPPHDQLLAPGEVGFDEEHTQRLGAPLSGRVAKIYVRPGMQVKAGDALLDIISPQVAELAAQLHKAEQDVALAAQDAKRTRALFDDGAVSSRELAQADTGLRKAEAELAQHRAHIKALGLQVERNSLQASLRARQAGTVVSRDATLGQEVRADAAESLVVLSDLTQVWVTAEVYEEQIAGIAVGNSVEIEIKALPHQRFHARVDFVSDSVDQETRSVHVRCLLPNLNKQLKPHMFAQMRITRRQEPGVEVPSQSVILEGATTTVVVVLPGDRLALRKVTLGPLVRGHRRVESGLVAGETVIVEGALLLHDALSQ